MTSNELRCCDNCEYSRTVLTLGGRCMTVCDGQDGDMREVMGNFRCDDFEPWDGKGAGDGDE